MPTINISFCFDDNLWRQAGVAIASLLLTAKGKCHYNIYSVVSNTITDEQKQALGEIVEQLDSDSTITFYVAADKFDHPQLKHAKGFYFRLYLPELLKDVDKIIYSDVDVIFNADLADLFNTDMGDNLLAGVKDGLNLNRSWAKYQTKTAPQYIVEQGKYINSGVMLINLKAMREENIYSRLLELVGQKLRYKDQDMLNYVCKGRILYLPLKYNFTPRASHKYQKMLSENLLTKSEITEARNSAAIFHFLNCNPWKTISKKADLWWKYALVTPLYDQFKEVFFEKASIFQKIKFLIRIKR